LWGRSMVLPILSASRSVNFRTFGGGSVISLTRKRFTAAILTIGGSFSR
jgi:hypothetical protein